MHHHLFLFAYQWDVGTDAMEVVVGHDDIRESYTAMTEDDGEDIELEVRLDA